MSKKYDSYKDSGVEWIGEIPSHWELKPLKHLVFCNKDSLVENTNPEIEINYIEIGDVSSIDGIKATTAYPFEKAPSRARRIVKEGDVIISTVRTYLKAITSIKSKFDGYIASTGFAVLTPKLISSGFLGQLVLNEGFIGEIISLSKGVSYPSITASDLTNITIPVPEPSEQTTIANYLDQKTTQIDDLIAKKERLIQLLEEERTAIINQAVTKGIVPTVPMKDSGIEWLGEIPEHWEVTKVKTVTKKIGSGVTPKGGAEIYELSGIPLLRSQNIYFDGFRLENVAYITSEIHDSMKNSQVQSGDVLLNITGGSIGRCYYVTDEFSEANVNQHVCIVRPNDRIITEFLYYVLSSTIGQQQIDLCQTGGNREALNFEQLKNFFMCLPEIDEQKSIVQQLNFKLNSINLAIEKFRKEIELIIEYKTALISEVVTGKVDVRQLVLN